MARRSARNLPEVPAAGPADDQRRAAPTLADLRAQLVQQGLCVPVVAQRLDRHAIARIMAGADPGARAAEGPPPPAVGQAPPVAAAIVQASPMDVSPPHAIGAGAPHGGGGVANNGAAMRAAEAGPAGVGAGAPPQVGPPAAARVEVVGANSVAIGAGVITPGSNTVSAVAPVASSAIPLETMIGNIVGSRMGRVEASINLLLDQNAVLAKKARPEDGAKEQLVRRDFPTVNPLVLEGSFRQGLTKDRAASLANYNALAKACGDLELAALRSEGGTLDENQLREELRSRVQELKVVAAQNSLRAFDPDGYALAEIMAGDTLQLIDRSPELKSAVASARKQLKRKADSAASGGTGGGGIMNDGSGGRRQVCYNCFRPGHRQINCDRPPRNGGGGGGGAAAGGAGRGAGSGGTGGSSGPAGAATGRT